LFHEARETHLAHCKKMQIKDVRESQFGCGKPDVYYGLNRFIGMKTRHPSTIIERFMEVVDLLYQHYVDHFIRYI
jgi:hypothetical protein